MSIGMPEILIFLAVIVLFFGASKIPELARGIGEGINEFKKVSDDDDSDDDSQHKSNSSKQQKKQKRQRVEVSEDK